MLSLKKYQEIISLLFYKHGLTCSTYPVAYIFGVILTFVVVCYPLAKMPFPGNAPLQYSTPIDGYTVPLSQADLEASQSHDPGLPGWYFDKPVSYVQQIVVKSAPRQLASTVEENIKSSLEPMFEMLNHIDAFRYHDGNQLLSMTDLCLRVAEVTHEGGNGIEELLPQYNCLFLSPARFWAQDKMRFLEDKDTLGTIFSKSKHLESSTSVKDILFGVPGVKRKNLIKLNNGPLLFAFTFAFKKYDSRFIESFHNYLIGLYPTRIVSSMKMINESSSSSSSSSSSTQSKIDYMVHVHYQNHNYFVEYTPFIFAYILSSLYLYFSVRKIEMVKSKWGLALSAMMTVVASHFMSLSLCAFVGLTLSLKGSEIFPYMVVVIGLENNLVITKSVVSTPAHLDVKLRIALGLQKEGWYILKNLMRWLFILTIGFFTFVPLIQEFCLFAILALVPDFFLQMFFFTTVLSVDIRRMELSDLQRHSRTSIKSDYDNKLVDKKQNRNNSSLQSTDVRDSTVYTPQSVSNQGSDVQPLNSSLPPPSLLLQRSSLSPPPTGPPLLPPRTPPPPSTMFTSPSNRNICDDVFSMDSEDEKIPKRVRLMHIWARYRVLQKTIMVFVTLWIALVVCKAIISDEETSSSNSTGDVDSAPFELPKLLRNINNYSATLLTDQKVFEDSPFKPPPFLVHENLESWKLLSFNHWKNLFDFYNISLIGRYITILPSIHISTGNTEFQHLPPGKFSRLQKKLWKKFENYSSSLWNNETSASFISKLVRYPRTNLELVLTVLLCIFSVILIICCVFILYKCLCSRRYRRWRSRWSRRSYRYGNHQRYYKQIRESMPIILAGHTQELECVCIDGRLLASSCLGGEVRLWDCETGECLSVIDRHRRVQYRPELAVRTRTSSNNDQRSTTSSASSLDCFDFFHEKKPSKHRNRSVDAALAYLIPDLTETIDTDFRSRARLKEADSGTASLGSSPSSNGFDFTQFQSYFDEQKKLYEARERMKALKKKKDQNTKLSSNRDPTPPPAETDDEFTAGSAIWCLAFKNNIVVLGCGSGDIEFWDVQNAALMACSQHSKAGVTAICLIDDKLVATRVDGMLDIFSLQQNTIHHWNLETSSYDSENSLQCIHIWSTKAHQMTINCLQTDGSRVFTASQDHMIKVHRLEDHACLYTLIGHTSCVTTLHVDKTDNLVVSGSDDGSLRLWDITSGSCLQKLVGHQSSITCIAYDNSIKRLFSVAMDDRLCIWEATRGHLLHCIQMDPGCCTTVAVFSNQLILTGGLGCLNLWDIETGTVVRTLNLSDRTSTVFVRQIFVTDNFLVVSDYGTQLRVLRFNMVLEKCD